ncbi:hypothetical protein BC830DRAFT_732804 [Chytriomyces sp. MP71]|nr:hypothetical protein BC830DRAFT_732804 [Chytriomyces sp. MP71]
MAPNPPESEYTLKEALTMLVPDPQRNSTAAARRNKKAGGFKLPSLTSRSRSRSPSPSPTISHPSTPYKITGDFKSGASSPAISSPTRSQSPSPSPSAFVSAQASPSESNAASPNMPNAPLPVPATNASLLVPSQSTSKLRRPASQILPTVEPPPVTKDPTKQMKASKEYRTVKEFKGSGADELPLEVGDIVETLPSPPSDKGAGWWYGISRTWGTNNGLKGFFPSDHVVLETFEDLAVQETRLLSTAEPATDDYIEEEFACELPDTVRPGIKLQCVYPYERTKADELEMEYGDVIVVLEAPEGGWWRGMKGFSTKAPTSGWFPCTMVTLAPGENIPGWSPTKIIKKRASEVAPSTVPVAEDQPVEIIPLKEDGEKNASLNEPSENTKSVKSESESSVAHESIREISRDPVIMETLEPPRNPEESGQSIEVTASGLIGLKPKSSNDTDIEVTDSEKTSDAATPSTSTSASRPLSRPVSRPSSRPGSRPGSRPPSRPVSSYVPALLETQSEASSDAMSSDASTNFNVLRTLDTIGITPLINSLDNINPASQPDASANSLLASNFSDAPTKPEIDTKNIIDRSPNAEPESCVPLEKPPSDSSSDSESPVPPRRIVGDANEGSQPKTVLTKPSRHIRAMSVPASPLGTMTAGSLGPVLDEPEPIEDGDMPRGTSSTTDGVGGVPGERWSYAYSKTGHNRSVSASETDKNSPRLSIISKSFMPHIEGSRTSMAFKKDDDTISIAPSDIHLPETPEAIEAKKNKREKIITELIETEKDYVRDLKIIIDTFMKPMANSKFDKNVDALFSNVDELLSINSEFLRRFEAKQRASPTFIGIGEIFLELI